MNRSSFALALAVVAAQHPDCADQPTGGHEWQPSLRAGHRRNALEAGPGELAVVAAHARRLGLQPARPDRSQQRVATQDGVDARPGHRQRGSDAARLRRRDTCRARATSSRPSTPRRAT